MKAQSLYKFSITCQQEPEVNSHTPAQWLHREIKARAEIEPML